ncbi:MAG: hypothetical protein ACFB5Z_10660 [Elainellaceae cyanobacterium]
MTPLNFTENRAIKLLSIALMSLALGLEIAKLSPWTLPPIPAALLTTARAALIIHLLEGAIAVAAAIIYRKPALRYGPYTFWVGTVGLVEIFKHASKSESLEASGISQN